MSRASRYRRLVVERGPVLSRFDASVSPAASPADVDLLGEPLHGRLLFAGEATTSARMGFPDGAMRSGIREAKRLWAAFRDAGVGGPVPVVAPDALRIWIARTLAESPSRRSVPGIRS